MRSNAQLPHLYLARGIRYVAVTVLLVSLSVGCKSSGSESDDGAVGRGDTDSGSSLVELPLAAILETPSSDLALLAEAENQLRANCMQDRGFDDLTPIRFETDTFNVDQRYGNRTVEFASENGYRPMNLESMLISSGVEETPPPETDAYLTAMFGEIVQHADGSAGPDGSGCEAIAATTIYGGPDRRYSFDGWNALIELDAVSYETTMASSTVKEAEARWAECMGGAGYEFSSPQDPLFKFPTPFDNPALLERPPTPDELQTATADAHCRAEVRLQDVYIDVESSVQRQLLETKSEGIASVKEQMDQAIETAKSILNS